MSELERVAWACFRSTQSAISEKAAREIWDAKPPHVRRVWENAAQAAIDALSGTRVPEVRKFPMQNGPPIPWKTAEIIYLGYSALWGEQQTLERLGERGGFGWSEVEYIYKECRRKCHRTHSAMIEAGKE